MPKLIIATRLLNGAPVLPPFTAEDGGVQLHYNYVNGVPQNGGWSIIGPYDGQSVMAMVEAPDTTITAMRADIKYLPIDIADEVKAKNWLLNNTAAKTVDMTKGIPPPILEAHKLTKAAYDKLIDTPWAKEAAVEK